MIGLLDFRRPQFHCDVGTIREFLEIRRDAVDAGFEFLGIRFGSLRGGLAQLGQPRCLGFHHRQFGSGCSGHT
jgi:hypothetical protein